MDGAGLRCDSGHIGRVCSFVFRVGKGFGLSDGQAGVDDPPGLLGALANDEGADGGEAVAIVAGLDAGAAEPAGDLAIAQAGAGLNDGVGKAEAGQ